jgi:8-oxo-dGTP diphosphatase
LSLALLPATVFAMKHVEVVAAVIIEHGKVLAAQRNARGEAGLKWEFPGGKIEANETKEQALERELVEELAIQSQVHRHLMTVEHSYVNYNLTMHCYLCTIVAGTIQLHEHIACRWLGQNQLSTVDWAPADIPVVEAIKALLT